MLRDYILVLVSLAVWGLGEGMFFYIQPLAMQRLGADPVTIGVVLSLYGIVMVISQVLSGFLGDRFGYRPFIWAAWIIATGGIWVMALAQTLPVFAVGKVIMGFAAIGAASQSHYMIQTGQKLGVGRAVTLMFALYYLGQIAGSTLGGSLGGAYGLQTTYLVSACISFLSTAILFFIRPIPPAPAAQRDDPNPARLFSGAYVAFLVVVACTMLASYLPQPLTASYLQDQRGLSVVEIGRLGSISGLGNFIILMALGRLAPQVAFVIGQALIAGYSLILWRGVGIGWFSAGCFLVGGYELARSSTIAITQKLAPASRVGAAFGIVQGAAGLMSFAGPLLAGTLYRIRPESIYVVDLFVLSFSLGLSILFFRLLSQRRDLDPKLPEAPPDDRWSKEPLRGDK